MRSFLLPWTRRDAPGRGVPSLDSETVITLGCPPRLPWLGVPSSHENWRMVEYSRLASRAVEDDLGRLRLRSIVLEPLMRTTTELLSLLMHLQHCAGMIGRTAAVLHLVLD